MTFRAKLECDAGNCDREYDLDVSHPADAEIEMYQIGWFRDEDNFADYCPKCTKKVKQELAEEG